MIHRISLCPLIRADYEHRQVFERYWYGWQHPMMDTISVRVNTDELRMLLDDAEFAKTLKFTQSPNLTRAYVRLIESARQLLRREPEDFGIGRDGKSAAAGDD